MKVLKNAKFTGNIKINDTNTDIYFQAYDDGVLQKLNANQCSFRIKNDTGYLITISNVSTKTDYVTFKSNELKPLPVGTYYLELWVEDSTGTYIYPDESFCKLRINENVTVAQGTTIPTISLEEYENKLQGYVDTAVADGKTEIKDDFDKYVDSITDSTIATATKASQDAATAISTANDAKSAAQNATNIANAAKSNADTASQNASTALNTANTAKSTADSASQTATTAQSTAETAKTTADSASQTASNAQTTASNASNTANTAKSTADSVLDSVNSLQNNLNNFGGRNYLLYSQDNTGKSEWAYTISNKVDGENFLGSSISKVNNRWNKNVGGYDPYNLIQRGIYNTVDEFVYSVYVKKDASVDNPSINIHFYSSATDQNDYRPDLSRISSDWTRIYVPFKFTKNPSEFSSDAPNYNDSIRFEPIVNISNGFLYFSCPKLEKGTIPTDYTPAPEDLQSEINTIKSQIQALQSQ